MKRLRMVGLVIGAAFCAAQANAEELTGTLKKIKETGAITHRLPRLVDSVLLSGRQPEADRLCDGHLPMGSSTP